MTCLWEAITIPIRDRNAQLLIALLGFLPHAIIFSLFMFIKISTIFLVCLFRNREVSASVYTRAEKTEVTRNKPAHMCIHSMEVMETCEEPSSVWLPMAGVGEASLCSYMGRLVLS